MAESSDDLQRKELIEAFAQKYGQFDPAIDHDDVAITYWLLAIQESLLAAADRALAQIGQERTRLRYGVLRTLLFADQHRLTHNRLMEILRVPASTVTFTVDALEREGVVTRMPHPNRRAAWIQLTPLGEKVSTEAVLAIAQSMHEIADAAFDPDAKAQFCSSLVDFYIACQQWLPTSSEARSSKR